MRKPFTIKLLLVVFCFIAKSTNTKAQIAAWDFTGQNTTATVAATTFNANLVAASNNITRGAGAAASAGANSFRTVGFKNDGIATSNTDYFQITLTAQSGFNLSLSSIDAKFNGTQTFVGAAGVSNQFAYSLDGTNFTLIGSASVVTGTVPLTLPTIDLTGISALQGVAAGTTVTLRFYASGQTATGGWGFYSSAAGVNGLSIGGSVVASNPTPTTTSISPASANAGDPGFALTVNGTNFINGSSTVTWNGANRTTAFVSATQLTATIPSSDIVTAGAATVGVTTTGAPASSNTQTFTINPAVGPNISLSAALTGFGNICINTTTAANSFAIDGSNLTGSPVTINIAALNGFTFSETLGGPYTSTLSFTTASSFTGKVIYVEFNPTAIQSYNGNIVISGGGVSSFNVAASGSGVNTSSAVTTNAATGITATSGIANASITTAGCNPVTGYGIEYSTTSGFPDGAGTKVAASNLSGGNFSYTLTGLSPNTRYYYKGYVTNDNGTTYSYGAQQAFNANPLPVVMASQPSFTFLETFADIVNWDNFFINGSGANHWDGLSSTATSPAAGIPNPTILTAATTTFQTPFGTPPAPSQTGGVQKGTDQTVPTQSIVLLSTGSTAVVGGVSVNNNFSSAAIDLYVDFTSLNAGTLSFDYTAINNGTTADNRPGSLRVYYSTNGTTFTELTNVLNFTNNVELTGTKSNIPLPNALNGAPNAIFRFYYYNGETGGTTGSRPKLAIDNVKIVSVPSTPCVAPSAPATNLTFTATGTPDVSIQGSFTAASPASDNYIVVMSTNNSLTGNPVDGQIYNIGDNLGDGTVVASGNSTTFTATGLNALTTYYFFVFPVNSACTGGPLYYTTTVLTGSTTTAAGLPPCAAPASQPTTLVLNSPAPTINTIQGSFTATTANEYLVLRSTASSLTNNPVDGHVYAPGDILGNAVVVQKSAATTFTATGLNPNTQYYFFVFSINSQACINGPAFNTVSPLTNNQTTQPLPPCAAPTAQPTSLALTASNTAISGTFTGAASADDYLVVRSTSPTLSATPTDNTDYNVGDIFGGGIVISNSAVTSFVTTGLTANTTYYFFVFAANKNCSGGTKYATDVATSNSIVTTNAIVNNYYFGTLHSHSDYSDGNKDNPGYTPAQDYEVARVANCMDYIGISEHNHFSSANNPGNSISNFHLGAGQATAYTNAHPGFLALYGMEWGVISNGGHVVIYGDGMDNLWGWESGSGEWGPTNNYDVYVPKSVYTGSTGLFKTVNDNIGTNTFATLAHPNLTDYNNIGNTAAYDVVADNAITGSAVESGPAFSTSLTYSDPASSMSYLWYYQTLLAKGYHLGPTIDHDNHNTTFGHTTTSRTAIIAPTLTKTAIISGMRNMNFYATQDCDSKVDFTINTKIMGSTVLDRFAPNIAVTLTDATTSTTGAIIRVMFGIPGSGVLPVKIDSVIGNSLNFADVSLANSTTGYYYIDITNGTSRIVTAPIWYTRNDNSLLAVKLNTFDVQKVGSTAKISWSTEQETNSSNFVIERSTDGRTWTAIATVAAAGNSSRHIDYSIVDNTPMKGINYYRLKEVDKDTHYDYSDIKKAVFNTNYTAMVAPNPATDVINLYISKTGNRLSTIQLLNTEGKMVYKTTSTQSQLQINTTNLAKGLYVLKVIDADNVTTIKVSVQ